MVYRTIDQHRLRCALAQFLRFPVRHNPYETVGILHHRHTLRSPTFRDPVAGQS
ncbi:hypothetical protein STH2241 [Symbiobacterium thermophilum IAM 14863]|uniref:Uncharacterized protein n=1 Tax=Symbiobacterium thermophilum (strain DSM 24528 / JCM 14929 / IAM 14863 / T) TaxID=292459 RepID=Q67M69_SYMTH|nr:hypothetical protein STH2241 [Symbiobacterium thermophilum IAM 14863]